MPDLPSARSIHPLQLSQPAKTGSHGLGGNWLFTDSAVYTYIGTSTDLSGVSKSGIHYVEDETNVACETIVCTVDQSTAASELAGFETDLKNALVPTPSEDDIEQDNNLVYHCITGQKHVGFENYNFYTASVTVQIVSDYLSAIVWIIDYANEYSSASAQSILSGLLDCIRDPIP